jgi:hypothetical protein
MKISWKSVQPFSSCDANRQADRQEIPQLTGTFFKFLAAKETKKRLQDVGWKPCKIKNEKEDIIDTHPKNMDCEKGYVTTFQDRVQ